MKIEYKLLKYKERDRYYVQKYFWNMKFEVQTGRGM